jgi:hypothetical protein
MKTKKHIIIEPEYQESLCGADWQRGEDRDEIIWRINQGYEISKNVCINCLKKLNMPYKQRY